MLPSSPTPDLEKALRTAQQGTTVFGGGLAVWGIAPIVVERVAGRTAPSADVLAFGLAVTAIGLGLIGLGTLIRRGKPWALWSNCAASGLVLVSSLWASSADAMSMPMFPVLLSTTAAVPGVLALLAARAQGSPWGTR